MATTFVQDNDQTRAEVIPRARKTVVGQLTTDGGDGAAAGDILASLFGLSFIEKAEPLVKSDNTLIVVVAPVYAGTSLIGKAAATAAAADIPSGTYQAVIYGY